MFALDVNGQRPWLAAATVALSYLQLVDAADVFQVPFTTDIGYTFDESQFDYLKFSINGTGQIGPDGPWQAAVIMLGSYQRVSLLEKWVGGLLVPMWPTGSIITQLLTTEGGGFYNKSANATRPWIEFGEDNEMVLSDYNARELSTGQGILDMVTMINARAEQPGYANINATIYAMNTSRILMRDPLNTTYTPEVGNLALGRPADVDVQNITFVGTSIIEQMKSRGVVKTNSFGLHLGSAPLNQKGSLLLGGYDESRVVGTVAAFEMQLGVPFIFLLDVFLGVETGAKHFTTPLVDASSSIWQGDAVDDASEHFGGKKGSVLILPNPAVPGLHLPDPTCANAAKYLPVHFDEATGYWLWDTTDPRYAPLISSGAYMSFVFSDMDARNVTIKIPMTLLNLTLDQPIVQTPTPYFPCHDVDRNNGYWELGRAFLQGSFFGINYEQNLTFLAQAPGPTTGQSLVHTIQVEDRTLKSQPDSAFLESWRASWPSAEAVVADQDDSKKPLSGGAIAGIVVGAVAGLSAVAILVFLFWGRRSRLKRGAVEMSELQVNSGGHKDIKDLAEVDTHTGVHEAAETGLQEAADTAVLELDSPDKTLNEAPTSPGVYELESPEKALARHTESSLPVHEMPIR
ncbi:hypothetical protein B0T24DRAFT_551245 [Lasiosphaeria ovina]|uniref:Peptidase A1 domain-containing protein n=1 Tax=Lasiosphaeria ovina TaxID=92902 RepID=A0AAE0KJT0_9PEZI|nr:hypothetical protein B0T24DRAFT_551245 [Lasiosphaeria ovina]